MQRTTLSWKITQEKPIFQVVLDDLVLTPCYFLFLITADVPKVYMHQFWDSVDKHDTFYRFKMDKRKRFKLTLEIFEDIFKICPEYMVKTFNALPTDGEIVSFLRDLGHNGEIHSLNDVVVDQIHQPWRTFSKLKSGWLGPYVVKYQYPSGYVELYGKDGKTFIVNGHRLKLYHDEEDYNDQREAVTPFFLKE
ncbi:hypothetical protein Tco_0047750 [Tanacetum coccineum]